MTVIRQESFTEALPELLPLMKLHWRETGLYRNTTRMKPFPHIAKYEITDKNGDLLTLVARQEREVVGYFIAFVQPCLHYCETLQAITDLPYVSPKVRGRGIGVRLFVEAEKIFKRCGVLLWQSGSKLNSEPHESMDRLLRHMKFEPTDMIYSKWLGD